MLLQLEGDGPLYARLYDTLRRQISAGCFAPGGRLPGTRSIARALGVSRTVVLQAYSQLESEGYTSTRVGSGTYVVDVPRCSSAAHGADGVDAGATSAVGASPLPEAPLSRLADRMRGVRFPDRPRALPRDIAGAIDLTDAAVGYDACALKSWRQTLSRTMRDLPTDVPATIGARPLRAALLDYLHRERAVVANIDDILVVNSAQQARNLIARVLVDEGSTVGVEDPCCPGVRQAFAAAGARVAACSVDAGGLDVDMHARRLQRARVLHVAPTCLMPSGAVMPRARRDALLQWAYRRPAWIVEEDVDCDHRYGVRSTPSLLGIDRHERVIYYMSGFARTIYPALQMSCVVVPPSLREAFRALKALSDCNPMVLRQYTWARHLASDEYMRGLRRLSQRFARKHRLFVTALRHRLGAAIRIEGKPNAGQLLVHLPALDATWATVLREEALRGGLLLQSAADWYVHRPVHTTLLLYYAALPEPSLAVAAERLALAYRRTWTDVGPRARLTA